jgi:hypothetical protein
MQQDRGKFDFNIFFHDDSDFNIINIAFEEAGDKACSPFPTPNTIPR